MKVTSIVTLGCFCALLTTSSWETRSQDRIELRDRNMQRQQPSDSVLPGQVTPTLERDALVPIYKPPLRGAPGGRVGGGTRGVGREVFILSVLAPDHTGLTLREQPSLYWFISSASSSPVEITFTDPRTTEPVLEARIQPPVRRGVHRIRLSDYGVHLAAGVTYQWYVAVVPDSERRSRDILAGGAIERADEPSELADRLSRSDMRQHASLYAEAGFWYDALQAISDLIEISPEDVHLRRQRATLTRQVGLPELGE